MYGGRVIALGSPAELKQSLGEGRLLYLESSDLLGSMTTLSGKAGILDVAVFGSGLHVKVADTDAGEDDSAARANSTDGSRRRRCRRSGGVGIRVL